jgi:hypothetical protein
VFLPSLAGLPSTGDAGRLECPHCFQNHDDQDDGYYRANADIHLWSSFPFCDRVRVNAALPAVPSTTTASSSAATGKEANRPQNDRGDQDVPQDIEREAASAKDEQDENKRDYGYHFFVISLPAA